MTPSRFAVTMLGLCLALAPVRALASPLLELTGDPFGQGGLNPRTGSRGAAASYFNPALLTIASEGLTLGFFVLSQQVRLRVDARASSALCANHACDVPAVNGAAPESFRRADNSALPTPGLPTAWLQDGMTRSDGTLALAPRPRQGAGTGQQVHEYLITGLVSRVWQDRLALGFYTMLPASDFMRATAFYSDEREQFFSNSLHPELYGDRLAASALVFGAGLRVSDALSLGAGFTMAMQSAADAPAYVSNLSDLDSLLIDSDVHAGITFAPHVGVLLQPIERLRASATLHSPQAADISTSVRYVIATGLEQHAQQSFANGYVPWRVAIGAELGLGENMGHAEYPWSLVGTVRYATWSQYRDRHGERPVRPYAWGNVTDASLGLRHQGAHLRGFADVAYQPSPVPAQTGRSNYVDNDRASFALGAAYRFEPWGFEAELGASAQLHALLERSAVKLPSADPSSVRDEVPDDAVGGTPRGPIPGREGLQTNNPGFPGFSSDGLIWGAGIHLRLGF